MLTVVFALSSASAAARQAASASASAAAPQAPPKVCVDAQAADNLIKEFADRLREAISASGTLTLAAATDPCDLQIHVPGNLLRFETAAGVMVSTVAIVTSPSGRYLSTSIAACQASNLEPCAVRAVAAAKIALLMRANGGT
ncbi:MAG TPA: hypothetical protein VIY50_05255 [Steroidobacteraceae bacterium]